MKKQILNPYLPSWEYIPDGEPYVFNGRVYVYGSHDRFNGHAYCLNDYVCWSAPAEDLADWRYEGLIYRKTDDPLNPDGSMCLYAPDVTVGPDGRYYLYYVLDKVSIVSVAVCDTPAGKYEFYGCVRYADGTRLGEREGDEPQFDPGVLTEGERTYLYTGFCAVGDKSRHGAMATVLGPDMLTVLVEPVFVAPSEPYGKGSGFEGHEFFEAPSIRKKGDTYYFIYSSIVMYELCYATSRHPTKGFEYRGVIVSNNDLHIDTYKPADKPMYYGGNNHGSIVEINGKWHIFYHRHTNGTNFSRQGCIEPIAFREDGTIPQAEMTSCGPNGGPLVGRGEYPAYLACNLFCKDEALYTGTPGEWMDSRFPKITQDGRDGDEEIGYIANMRDCATAGFNISVAKESGKSKSKYRAIAAAPSRSKRLGAGRPSERYPSILRMYGKSMLRISSSPTVSKRCILRIRARRRKSGFVHVGITDPGRRGWDMENLYASAVPADYKRAVKKELQGTLIEIAYPVRNYINASRQLVTDRRIDSAEAGRETASGDAIVKTCNVYLPAGYDENVEGNRYNVLYLLHGVGGDPSEWLRGNGQADGNFVLCNILDNLIATGEIDPLIVVFPNGRSAHDNMDRSFNSEGTNMLGFYYFDYELRYDLIPFIESTYRTHADITDTSAEGIAYNRLHRAIAGLSMGGMQCLNLILGGCRCDSVAYAEDKHGWKNGLDTTVLAPGMVDLFAYTGVFSNAPTSSEGPVLGASLASAGHKLHLLYMTCGDRDEVSIGPYDESIEGLADAAGDKLGDFYQVIVPGGVHDFEVWNHGAYNFSRLAFRHGRGKPHAADQA